MLNKNALLSAGIFLFLLVFCGTAYSQTYTTIANGNWTATTTWDAFGVPPTASDIPVGAVINIRHTVEYDTGNNVINRGEIRIQRISGTMAILNVPTSITFETASTGRFLVINGTYRQCRFTPCNDGQPYAGNTPGAPLQSGNLKNNGGYNEGRNCNIEIAQDWTNEAGGDRVVVDCCVKTGQNFSITGVGSTDSITRTLVSVGWHGSGSYELAVGTATYNQARFQLAGTSGNFKLNSGTITAGSDIDIIALRNHIVPFTGSGEIFADTSLVGTVNLDAYCVITPDKYIPNGKFTGPQVANTCSGVFPCPPPTAAAVEIGGRVFDDRGRGVPRARVLLTDPNGNVRSAITSSFGYYRLTEVASGETYVVDVRHKRFVYDPRVINVVENISDLDFVPQP